jgi:glycine/D-amino acid oxidase-like deaminating enzyme
VNVSRDRVTRVITGLRPYRPSGFVVRAEKLDDKTVIHNYGHGGAGITLSWGTAQLAADLAGGSDPGECAVLGCGVVGLSTARILQQRGYSPTIYAREMPPNTTSNVAGGLWEPVTLYDDSRVTPAFLNQFNEAAKFAFRRYQTMASDQYAVRWLPVYFLSQRGPRRPPQPDTVDALYPEQKQLPANEHPFAAPYAYRMTSMLIEPSLYLPALMRDFYVAGGRIIIREFAEKRELMALREKLIFNCTGLGAGKLFGDTEITPVKGQLVFLLPQPEIDYMTIGPSGYMFPRHDGIVLGGSHDEGVWSLDPDPAVTERILRDNGALYR